MYSCQSTNMDFSKELQRTVIIALTVFLFHSPLSCNYTFEDLNFFKLLLLCIPLGFVVQLGCHRVHSTDITVCLSSSHQQCYNYSMDQIFSL